MSFTEDIRVGTAGERFIKKLFKMHKVDVEFGKDKKHRESYDLIGKIGRSKLTIEVKFDKMAEKTGNLAIEYHNPKSGKPSGISVTKAKLWAHVVLDCGHMTAWLASTKELKAYIEMYEPRKMVFFGGDKNANLYLYEDIHILKTVFNRIDTIFDESKFQKLVKKLIK
jgi:hypothetical protein